MNARVARTATAASVVATANTAAAACAWLTPLVGHWTVAARTHLSRCTALVRVTVIRLRGSAPREPGASMLVDVEGSVGTIGGGRLEWHAIAAARGLLRDPASAPVRVEDLVLGPELGQCCGGRVELWLERLTQEDIPWLDQAARSLRLVTEVEGDRVSRRLMRSLPGSGSVHLRRVGTQKITLVEELRPRRSPLWIFGAGHVGQALVRLLGDLALFDITWIDPRPELLPTDLPDGVTAQTCAAPAGRVARARPGTSFVVMSHDHLLDYQLCRSILERGDAAFLGLIGSASKSARFRARLLREGVDAMKLRGLTCPIGIPGIASKLPAAIAIAIAADLLQRQAVSPARAGGGEGDENATSCTGECASCGAARRPAP